MKEPAKTLAQSVAEAKAYHPDRLWPCSQCKNKDTCRPVENTDILVLLDRPNPGKEVACNNQSSPHVQEAIFILEDET